MFSLGSGFRTKSWSTLYMTRQAQPSVIDPRPDIAAPNHGPNYALSGRGQCKSANTLAIMRSSQARLLAFDRAKRSSFDDRVVLVGESSKNNSNETKRSHARTTQDLVTKSHFISVNIVSEEPETNGAKISNGDHLDIPDESAHLTLWFSRRESKNVLLMTCKILSEVPPGITIVVSHTDAVICFTVLPAPVKVHSSKRLLASLTSTLQC